MDSRLVPPVAEDFIDAELGDRRLTKRLLRIAEAAQRAPSASLPQQAGSSAALEGTYRFFANERVTPSSLFHAHTRATVRRAARHDKVLVIHDSTEFRFGGTKPRTGMGWLSSDYVQGFLAHFSFCVTPSGRPLGNLGLHAWVRQGAKVGRRKNTSERRDPDRESHRWQDAALLAGELLHEKTEFIHVMDREADHFELMSMLIEHEQRFVIRLGHNRKMERDRGRTGNEKLFESLSRCPFIFSREVQVAARTKPGSTSRQKQFPVRERRTARLEIRAGSREIFTVHSSPAHVPPSLRLQVVEVREVDAPAGEEPILWRLLTTEPLRTETEVAAVVDAYRQRWIIEEFFKALKTGCRYQQLQLESARALLNALSIEVAVAWRMLLLRWVVREEPDASAKSVMTTEHLHLLTALAASETGRALPKRLSARMALLALARLGGHIENNGTPGWLVLRRGLDTLEAIHRGWALARGP